MGPYDVIAVGDVLLDVEAGALPAAGAREHAPVRLVPGGSSLRAALAAAAEGATALVVGRVGADGAAELLRRRIRETPGLEGSLAEDPEAPTGIAVALAGGAVVADPGASARLAPADLPERLVAGAVLVSGYALLREGPQEGALAALARAEAPWVAVDAASPGLVRSLGPERFAELARGANALFANAEEARALTGLEPRAAALELGRRYPLACVKLGGEGALLVRGGEVAELPPAGAAPGDGDALAGRLLARLALG